MGLSVVSNGGGVNSTALLVELANRGERPDAILFADTGGEQYAIYEYLRQFGAWLVRRDFPPITIVRKTPTIRRDGSRYATLEEDCLLKGMLPSLAYGGRGCSWKYKREVMDKWVNNWQPAQDVWDRKEKVTRLIGFDAGERRTARGEEGKYVYRYPLREWGWDRKACEEAIARAGLCVPPKSACFFCPAAKKAEVRRLAREEPDLFGRAVAMERKAKATGKLTSVKGLGRHWSWEDIAAADKAQLKLFEEPPQMPCECWT
jgi:hypothetical protein